MALRGARLDAERCAWCSCPRHPDRAAEIAASAHEARAIRGAALDRAAGVGSAWSTRSSPLLVDTIGELERVLRAGRPRVRGRAASIATRQVRTCSSPRPRGKALPVRAPRRATSTRRRALLASAGACRARWPTRTSSSRELDAPARRSRGRARAHGPAPACEAVAAQRGATRCTLRSAGGARPRGPGGCGRLASLWLPIRHPAALHSANRVPWPDTSSPPSPSPWATPTRWPTRSPTPSSTPAWRRIPDSRVACEVLVTTGLCVVAGEITTKAARRLRPGRARARSSASATPTTTWGINGKTCARDGRARPPVARHQPGRHARREGARTSRAPATRA